MDSLFRFSNYDLFAYVAAGFAAFVVADLGWGAHLVLCAHWTTASGVVTVVAAYVVGHLIAGPSEWLIGKRFVGKMLGPPAEVFFPTPPPDAAPSEKKPTKPWLATCLRRLLPGYFEPLDDRLKARILAHALNEGEHERDLHGESFFWIAYPRAKRDPLTHARMDTFLTLYGFCRNLAFVGLFGGIVLAVQAALRSMHVYGATQIGYGAAEPCKLLAWAVLAFLLGLVLLYRYVIFYRHYASEVFVGYMELPPGAGGGGGSGSEAE